MQTTVRCTLSVSEEFQRASFSKHSTCSTWECLSRRSLQDLGYLGRTSFSFLIKESLCFAAALTVPINS